MQNFKLKRSGTIAVQLVFLLFFNGKANAQTLSDVQFVKGVAGQDSVLKANISGNESIGSKEILRTAKANTTNSGKASATPGP